MRDRWDFDFGALDSYSGTSVVPSATNDGSSRCRQARLKEPEELGHGDIVRTTASASWLKRDGENFTAVTAAYGVNNGEDATRGALLLEATRALGRYSAYGRLEFVEVETGVLLDDHALGHDVEGHGRGATLGVVRELPRWRRLETGIGAAATFYGVPDRLDADTRQRPVSFQVFFRAAPGARRDGTDVEHAHDQAHASGGRRSTCRASDALRRINA